MLAYGLETRNKCDLWFPLGPVDIHFNAMTAAVRLIMAAKL